MSYALGIDLGTTFSAAATWRDGRAEIAPIGDRSASIPSVVLLRDDSSFLTGDAAHRRGTTEPQRVAREFKRRFGDPTPIILGGSPHSAEALTARLLRAIVDDVAQREGEGPERICISHPANWGPYKLDLLRQTVRLAELDQPVEFTTEPEAAAVFYAAQRPLEPGANVAVYDLGGGTFDAAIVRRTETGFVLTGKPEGIERLGGIDIDAAVFDHVRRALDGRLDELDQDDPSVVAAVARLRAECVSAKEALSSDTDVTIPVLLPAFTSEVRLTRSELETMVRPALLESIGALRRTLESAQITAEQLFAVLLVGGSSRIPIVSQLVSAELGRPVVVDAHPKHAIALGAAIVASGQTAIGGTPTQTMTVVPNGGQTSVSVTPTDLRPPPPPPHPDLVDVDPGARTQMAPALRSAAPPQARPAHVAAGERRYGYTQPPEQGRPYDRPSRAVPPRYLPAALIGLVLGLGIGLVALLLI